MIAHSLIFPMALSDRCRSDVYGVGLLKGKLFIRLVIGKAYVDGQSRHGLRATERN